MLKQIANNVRGYLKIRVTGYSPERFLNLCKNKNIEIWDLQAKSNAYEMFITIDGFRNLKPLLKKTRTKIVVLEKCGTPFFFHKYRKRKVFFCGIFLSILLIYGLSLFIWNIEIEGNSTITDEALIEYLETENVYHGMRKSQVTCEMISTKIRQKFNEIIWVSVSLEGSNIMIHVKENTDTFQVSQTEESPADIVASSDGIITEIITRSGVPCVSVGDTVTAGDVLVTGKIEVKNDAGEVVREDYKTADADIYAEVIIPYEEFCETVYAVKDYNKNRQKQVYLKIFDYQIAFGLRKYKTEGYEISSKETQLKLNKNFRLPIVYGEVIGNGYEFVEAERTKEEKESILNSKIEWYCKKLEEEGSTILEKNIQITEETKGTRAKGYLKLEQPIGTLRKTIDF